MGETLEGGRCHQELMKQARKLLTDKGYKVVYRARVNGGVMDVIGFKGDETIGIECQVRPIWKVLKAKMDLYKDYVSKLIVAFPKDTKVKRVPDGLEIIRLNVLKPPEKGRLCFVAITKELEQRFRKVAANKFGSKAGFLKKAFEEAAELWFQQQE